MEIDTLPLRGLKVLDLGTILMAPYAGQWLADLGADVIKVEAPGGDASRRIGPADEPGMAAMFLALNRNKSSVELDLKTDAGKAEFMRLVEDADVVLHNNRPQKMTKLGLGPQDLIPRFPGLIYACLHGFGEDGPYGGRPAYDDIVQGMCGFADLMAQQTGEPRYLPSAVADKVSGLTGTIAILAALVRRERTGMGGYVEIPMFESMVAFTLLEHLYGAYFDPPLGETMYPRVMTPERRPFATADGHICVMPYTDRHWKLLFEACERPDLAGDARFSDISARTGNSATIYADLAALLSTRKSNDWLELFERLEIPCGPYKRIDELIDDPHLKAVGFFATLPTEFGRKIRYPGVPVLYDGHRPSIKVAPRLNEHSRNAAQPRSRKQ